MLSHVLALTASFCVLFTVTELTKEITQSYPHRERNRRVLERRRQVKPADNITITTGESGVHGDRWV